MAEDLVQLARRLEPLVECGLPASESAVSNVESQLGVRLSGELRQFLLQANGATVAVKLDSGQIIPRASPLVWSIDVIGSENANHGDDGRPSNVLFFANAGVDGILFGHPVDPTGAAQPAVVAWYPLERETVALAGSIRDYLQGWLSGALRV